MFATQIRAVFLPLADVTPSELGNSALRQSNLPLSMLLHYNVLADISGARNQPIDKQALVGLCSLQVG